MTVSRNNVSLVRYFSEFYQEIADIKKALFAGTLADYLSGNNQGRSDIESLVSGTSLRLYGYMVRQAREVREQGTEQERKLFTVAQYVMAALADEVFILEVSWLPEADNGIEDRSDAGNRLWGDYLLEGRLFKSAMAGRNIFDNLDRLLKVRARSDLHKELAVVFLMALQLGFKGQHTGVEGNLVLRQKRRQLLKFIGFSPDSKKAVCPQVFQEEYTLSKAQGATLAPLSRWYWIGGSAFALYLIVSSGVWFFMTSEVRSNLPSRCELKVRECKSQDANQESACLTEIPSRCETEVNAYLHILEEARKGQKTDKHGSKDSDKSDIAEKQQEQKS